MGALRFLKRLFPVLRPVRHTGSCYLYLNKLKTHKTYEN